MSKIPYFRKIFAQNTKVKLVFQFLNSMAIFFPFQGFSIPGVNLSDPYASLDTLNGKLYDILCHMACHTISTNGVYGILCHMPYEIKCHKVCQHGYQNKRFDQTNWSLESKTLGLEKLCQKMQKKTETLIFPLYFKRIKKEG